MRNSAPWIGDGTWTWRASSNTSRIGTAGASSDHASFRDAGVPVVMFTREDDVIHTTKDAMDRISADSLRDSVTAAYATLASLQP